MTGFALIWAAGAVTMLVWAAVEILTRGGHWAEKIGLMLLSVGLASAWPATLLSLGFFRVEKRAASGMSAFGRDVKQARVRRTASPTAESGDAQ